jgi:hypothetical protein
MARLKRREHNRTLYLEPTLASGDLLEAEARS